MEILAFVAGTLFGAACFYVGFKEGNRKPAAEEEPKMTEEEKEQMKRDAEYERQFANLMAFTGRKRA